MANTAEVRLILNAVDNASKTLGNVNKELSVMQKVSKTAGDFAAGLGIQFGTITNPAMFAGQAVKYLALQTWELGKQGAVVVQTAESWELLLEKVGASPDLLDELRVAANGTISDMQLMSATSTLLAGAQGDLATSLANATPELLEIAKAAQKLNPSLGDTAFLYDSIATGIKRASPMILDNLGLTIKIGEANEEYAKSLGKTVEQLTADEQKQALLNATIKAGNVLIQQAGGTTDSATDAFQRLEAQTQNLKDTFSKGFTPAATDAANVLTDIVELMQESTDKTALYNEAVELGLVGQREMANSMRGTTLSAEELKDRIDKYTTAQEAALKADVDKINFMMGAVHPAMDTATTDNEELTAALWKANDATLATNQAMKQFTTELLFSKAAANMTDEAALSLAYAMGLVDERTMHMNEVIPELTAVFDSNKDGIIDADEAAKGYNSSLANMLANLKAMPKDVDVNVSVTTTYSTVGGPPSIPGGSSIGTTIVPRAHGGPVTPGGTYLVGEGGVPELLTLYPGGGGMVQPVTNNNNLTMNVYTGASSATVQRDFAIMQSMIGAS